MILVALALVSASAFFLYGFRTILSFHVRHEFRRYGIPHLRTLTGVLQMLGAGGVLIGLAVPALGVAASGGLLAMMLLGLDTRRRLADPWRKRIQATTFAVVNGALVVLFVRAGLDRGW